MKKFVARTTMPKRGKLITAYKDGDTFRKYCLTYGTIVEDHKWDDLDGKPMREYQILIDGVQTRVRMKCGEVVAWGYGLVERSLIV